MGVGICTADLIIASAWCMVLRHTIKIESIRFFQNRYLFTKLDHGVSVCNVVLRIAILLHVGLIKEKYSFLSHAGSARGLVGFMNFLMWFGNTTILLMAGMMGIDPALFEAAEVDGATSTQVFFRITMPLLRPILVYVLITSLIGGLQMFDVPQILTNGTGGPTDTTMTLIMYLNKQLYSKNYGMGGALSVLLFIVTGILSLIVFKAFAQKKEA